MMQNDHPSVREQSVVGTEREVLCLGFRHSPGSAPPTGEDYIQLLKLGFSGMEAYFPTLWNYKAHESKQISLRWGNGEKISFGKTENKLLCTNSFRHLHTHTENHVSLCSRVPLGHSPLDLSIYVTE